MTNIGALRVNPKYGYDHDVCLKCGVVPISFDIHTHWHFSMGQTTPIELLNLPLRFYNSLRRHGIYTVEAMIEEINNYQSSPAEWVYDTRNIGHKIGTDVLLTLADQQVLEENTYG